MNDAPRNGTRTPAAGGGFVFEYHDEVLRRRVALSAENFLSDLAAALDAKEVARRKPAYEALLAALREIERLDEGDA